MAIHQALLLFLLMSSSRCFSSKADQGRQFWYEEAGRALHQRLRHPPAHTPGAAPRARSVILLVGDGLGLTTSTAARILRGQRQGQQGEDSYLSWDRFPAVALSKTYNLDAQIGESSACATALLSGVKANFETLGLDGAHTYNLDAQIGESSACATALLSGVKANFETLGLDGGGKFEDCFSSLHSRVDSIMTWAQHEGKATGLVTNTRVSHATPAALYAHAASRYWEDDGKVPPKARKTCKDITRQLIEDEPGRNFNVVLGGGRRHWLPKVARDPELTTEEGRRLDGRNLVDDWLRDKKKRGLRAEYVWNKHQLDTVSTSRTDYLLGLFAYSHMEFEAERDQKPSGDPSVAEMTAKALKILMKNPHGFFLFVESGRIDHAHHYNNPYRALDETLVLDDAVKTVLSTVDLTDTLVVVTSDHSHVMTLGGLATPRGNPILGTDPKPSDMDGLAYSSLLYGNGPGYTSPRAIPSNNSEEEKNAVHGSAVPRQWATHGGEDVPVYAQGPLATTLFSGTVDQSYIPHAIAYIACLGPHKSRCTAAENTTQTALSPPPGCAVTEGSGSRGAGLVLASSVMSDDISRTSHCCHLCYISKTFVCLIMVLVFAAT